VRAAAARAATAALAAGAMVVALALGSAACKKRQEEPPAGGARPAPIGEVELARGRDACGAYVEAVCACAKTVPAAEQPCARAPALSESIETATEVAAHPATERLDAVQSAAAVRKIIARCLEHTARLPELGCAAPGMKR
jgi:hypothetical protein